MRRLLEALGASSPVVAAPMAGGPTTPGLVTAAAATGSLGFLAGGYLTAEDLAGQVAEVRRRTDLFGVNLFAPPPVPVDRAAYASYRALLAREAEHAGVDLPATPVEDDDAWRDKVEVLLAAPVPVVSFTFAIPATDVVTALRRAGSVLVQTVTSVDEARGAVAAGLDAVLVQAPSAGGHSGTLTPADPLRPTPLPDLVAAVAEAVEVPLLAAGGIATPDDVAAALAAGADGVAVGTLLLLADESGTSAAHRAGLADHARTTTMTRAFTGRPARGLRNQFVDRFESAAPLGYPALHHLTRPLRRAAAAVGDPERVNLWAGAGFRHARSVPAAEIVVALAGRI